jgi:hypothetical protein
LEIDFRRDDDQSVSQARVFDHPRAGALWERCRPAVQTRRIRRILHLLVRIREVSLDWAGAVLGAIRAVDRDAPSK